MKTHCKIKIHEKIIVSAIGIAFFSIRSME
jgi:hypothetical protein